MIGKVLGGRYKIIEMLGQGEMGTVYKAYDTRLERTVAIRVLSESLSSNTNYIKRFYLEAGAIAQLSHPNIVSIYDIDREDSLYYISMEYLKGKTLRELLEETSPLPIEQVLDIAIAVCEALDKAHQRGIIHRDIKPDNIMVTEQGIVKVMDFGLARTRNPELTESGEIRGTAAYMSSEQARGEKVDHHSDLYSVGVVIYELSTGQPPFNYDNFIAVIIAHIEEEPRKPTDLNPSIPQDLEKIILKAMSKKLAERYQSAYMLRNDLYQLKERLYEEAEIGYELRAAEKRIRVFNRELGRVRWLLRKIEDSERIPEIRSARRELFKILSKAEIWDRETLDNCIKILKGYLKEEKESKWQELREKLTIQKNVLDNLHLAVRGLIDPSKTVDSIHKMVMRAYSILQSTEIDSLPAVLEASPFTEEERNQLENLRSTISTSLRALEVFFNTYFKYLEAKGYNTARISRLVLEIIREFREEERKGFRTRGLFVDPSTRLGYISDIIVTVSRGMGEIRAGNKIEDEVMKRAVENAIEAAYLHLEQEGFGMAKEYDVSWQIEDIKPSYEGDSLGLTIAIALISNFYNEPVDRKFAFTGVVAKDGGISRVGSIAAKLKVAYEMGIEVVVIPYANAPEIPEKYLGLSTFQIRYVRTLEEAIEIALPDIYRDYLAHLIEIYSGLERTKVTVTPLDKDISSAEIQEIEEALEESKRMVLLGAPVDTNTALKCLALKYAQRRLLSGIKNSPIPILVKLDAYGEQNLLELIRYSLESGGMNFTEIFLERQLRNHKFLLLFSGLNNVDHLYLGPCTREIKAGFLNSEMIVSCERSFYENKLRQDYKFDFVHREINLISVEPDPVIVASLEAPRRMIMGLTSQVELRMENVGNEEALEVALEVCIPKGFEFSRGEISWRGAIPAHNFKVLTYELTPIVYSEEPVTFPSILISYENERGDKLESYTKQIQVEIAPSLVGRDDEFELLRRKMKETLAGRGQIVLISGERGIGKTALGEQFLSQLEIEHPQFRLAKVRCTEISRNDLLFLFREALREFSTWQAQFELEFQVEGRGGGKDYEQQRYQMFSYLSQRVVELTKDAPLVLFCDDLQWADPTSLDLLSYLLDKLSQDIPLLFLCTYREEELESSILLAKVLRQLGSLPNSSEISLKGLGSKQMVDILQQNFPGLESERSFIERLHQLTDGNPFFIIETLRLLSIRGSIAKEEEYWRLKQRIEEISVPESISLIIEECLSPLKREERGILECASVIGNEFTSNLVIIVLKADELGILSKLSELEQDYQLIHLLETEGVLSLDFHYRFHHTYTQQVLYNSLPLPQKILYHRAIGEALENICRGQERLLAERAGELSYHFLNGRNPAKAVIYLKMSGDNSFKYYSYPEAISSYMKALGCIEQLLTVEIEDKTEYEKQKLELLLARGDIKRFQEDRDSARGDYEEALTLAKTDRDLAGIYRRLGNILDEEGNWEEALKIYDKALSYLGDDLDNEIAAEIYGCIGRIYEKKGQYDKAVDYLMRDLSIVEQLGYTSETALVESDLGIVHLKRGDLEASIEHQKRSLQISIESENRIGEARAYNRLGWPYWSKGERKLAIESHQKSLEISDEIGDVLGASIAANNLGVAYWYEGDWSKAIEYYVHCLETREAVNDIWRVAHAHNNLGLAYWSKGEWDEALSHYRKCLEICEEQIDDPWLLGNLYNNFALLYWGKGEDDKAIEYIKSAFQIGERIEDIDTIIESYLNWGTVYSDEGALDKALENYFKAQQISQDKGITSKLAEAYRGLGEVYLELGDLERAEEYCQKVEELMDKDSFLDRGRLERTLGMLYQLKGEHRKAEEHFEESLESLQKIEYELGRTYLEAGILLSKLRRKEKANEYLKNASEIFERLGAEREKKKVEGYI